jgi:hypothetical protein
MGAKTHLQRHISEGNLCVCFQCAIAGNRYGCGRWLEHWDEIVGGGVTPVPGFTVDRDKIPGNIQTLRSSDLTRNGAASVLNALSMFAEPSWPMVSA